MRTQGRRTVGEYASIAATVLLSVSALTIAALLFRREFGHRPPNAAAARFEAQPDWREYAGEGHRIGRADASVVIVEFADFECPACRALEPTLREVRERYTNDVAFVYRHYPLAQHRSARAAAVAAECAGAQGRFDRMHSALFAGQESLGLMPWERYAQTADVPDLDAFTRCLVDSMPARAIARDVAAADRLGVRGTPTVLINGVRFTGSAPAAIVDSLVQAALRPGKKGA